MNRLLLLRHCCFKAMCHNFPVKRAAAIVKAKPNSSCPVLQDFTLSAILLYIPVIPNRGSQLAFLRLLLTFENPTKILKKSIYNKKIKFIFKNYPCLPWSLEFIIKMRGKLWIDCYCYVTVVSKQCVITFQLRHVYTGRNRHDATQPILFVT